MEKNPDVYITNDGFAPSTLTVNVADVVTFHNDDNKPHTITSTEMEDLFDSGEIAADGAWNHEFPDVGTFEYGCKLHPGTQGRIDVEQYD